MRRLAHISDLHFGHEEPELVEALLRELHEARPDLVVVSGDLTEKARRAQFELARAFLQRLPAPFLAVPGNHDVPIYELLRGPLHRYRRYIAAEALPTWVDDELAVVGVSTARPRAFHRGRITSDQLRALRSKLMPLPPEVFKVVVAHHPLVPDHAGEAEALGMRGALNAFDLYGVDLVLAGHLHSGFAGHVRTVHPLTRTVIGARCGASASTHERGEPNSYNLIDIAHDEVVIRARTFSDGSFHEALRTELTRAGDDWRSVGVHAGEGAAAQVT